MFVIFPILYGFSLLHICLSSVNICSAIIGSSDSCSHLLRHFILFVSISIFIFFPFNIFPSINIFIVRDEM
jgi:hypothetical protein